MQSKKTRLTLAHILLLFFLEHAVTLLNDEGRIYIECRSINDRLAHKGEVLSPTERIHGHYRRFIIKDELIGKIDSLGLHVLSEIESPGLAVLGDDDPIVIRVVAEKCTLAGGG